MRVHVERIKARELAYQAGVQGSPVLRRTGEGATECSRPVELHMFGYPDPMCLDIGTEPDRPVSQRMEVRCRKCEGCLRARARLWTARAIDETKVSARTWFGTLTLSQERQLWARYSALKRIGEKIGDPDAENVFRESVVVLNKELTLFLKRVRKVERFRYLLVTEAHKSGLPHFHILIHEYEGRISKRDLEDKWRFGFSHWRLVPTGNEAACGYCCKYLAKSALTRVRASEDYGRAGFVRPLTERLNAATRFVSEAIQTGSPQPVQKG